MLRSERKPTGSKSFARSIFLGGITAIFISMVLFLLCAVLILAGWLEYDQIHRYAIASCSIAVLFSGFLTSRFQMKRRIFAGISVGAIEFLILLFIALSFIRESFAANAFFPLSAASLCSGALSGILSSKRKKRRHA